LVVETETAGLPAAVEAREQPEQPQAATASKVLSLEQQHSTPEAVAAALTVAVQVALLVVQAAVDKAVAPMGQRVSQVQPTLAAVVVAVVSGTVALLTVRLAVLVLSSLLTQARLAICRQLMPA
jgi:hypothetical protein